MKFVLSILSILVVIAVYSTGAFVSESQGMTDTVAGLAVLSDAEMAEQVGGSFRNKTNIKWQDEDGSVITVCYESYYLFCFPAEKTWIGSRYNCVQCTPKNKGKAYKSHNPVKKIVSKCFRSYGCCKLDKKETKQHSCDNKVHERCNW